VSPEAEQPDILKRLAELVPKIKTRVQLAGLVEIIIAVVLLAKNSLVNAAGIFGLGMLFLVFGQVFPQLDKLPGKSRTPFLLWSLFLFILAFALNLTFTFIVLAPPKCPTVTVAPSPTPTYPPAEQKLVDLNSEVAGIKAGYVLEAKDVNKQARQLAERLLAVDDGQISLGMQIYKYEAVAYSWAMVAGSEDNPEAKLATSAKILKVTEKGNKLIEEAMRAGPLDTPKMRNMRDWIIKDNAAPRLQRLAAIALCVRWQVKKNPADRLAVRQIIRGLPYDYLNDEQPQKTSELRPCLVDNGSTSQPSSR
jgi:hypothetical protein